MSTYRFRIAWEVETSVNALTEDEAWDAIHDEINGDISALLNRAEVNIYITDSPDVDEWGRFDQDPEDGDMTEMVIESLEPF